MSTNHNPSRRARKRAAMRAKQAQLSSARAALFIECDGDVPEHWRGLNLHNTLRALESARHGHHKPVTVTGRYTGPYTPTFQSYAQCPKPST